MSSLFARWWKPVRRPFSLEFRLAVEQLEGRLVPSSNPMIRIAGLGGNHGELAANLLFSSDDLSGSVYRDVTTAQFNALSPGQLRAAYDLLLITWDSPTALDLDWNTRLLPYLNAGGNVIYEDPNNLGDLAPLVTGTAVTTNDLVQVAPVPTLTDGITGDLGNSHIRFTSWDSSLTAFLTAGQNTLGLYGQFGDGRMLLTGPGQDHDGVRNSSDPAEANAYNLLRNEVRWEVAPWITPPGPQTVLYGSAASVDLGSFRDPIANDGPWTVTVNWNDGTSPTSFAVGSQGALGFPSHTFLGRGEFQVTVTVVGALQVAQQATLVVHVTDPTGQPGVGMTPALLDLLPDLPDPLQAPVSAPAAGFNGNKLIAPAIPSDVGWDGALLDAPGAELDASFNFGDGTFTVVAFSPQFPGLPGLFASFSADLFTPTDANGSMVAAAP